MVEVRRTSAEQWQAVKQVRLQALADSPSAFGSTLARELALDDAEWQRRAAGTCLLAWDDGDPVGTVAVVPDPDAPRQRQVVGMWVSPGSRGRGVARALVEQACAAAAEQGAAEVYLWVADGNDRARALYERCGFALTGERQPLPSDPAVGEQRLRRALTPPALS